MIDNFFTIISKDLTFVQEYFTHPSPGPTMQEKVGLVACRLIAAVGMALSFIHGMRALGSANTLKLIVAGGFYTVSHDLFVICKNVDNGHLIRFLSDFVFGLAEMIQGVKDDRSVPSYLFSQGTFYKPFWDHAYASLSKS